MDDVFSAIADTTRRQMLARLHSEGALSVTQLTEPMSVSRQAVTKHLNVLENAGLIVVYRQGRERLHKIQPRPLQAVDDWLRPYAQAVSYTHLTLPTIYSV